MLKTRAIAALIFAPALLALVLLGGLPLQLTCLVLVWLMLWEFLGLTLGPGQVYLKIVGYLFTSVVAQRTVELGPTLPYDLLLPVGTMLLFAAILWRPEPLDRSMHNAAVVIFGAAYCGGLIPYLSRLREIEQSAGWAFMALFCTWGADTGAYFAGRLFGRHKLYPLVSPGKTWEGLVGGLVWGIGVAFLVRHLFGMDLAAHHLVVIGTLAAVIGLIGDLSESLLKRSVSAKDSGTLIPGHGGVLDRFDAVMFAAPAIYIYASVLTYWRGS